MNTPIKLLLVDDHAILRMGLKQLLETDPRLEIVGEAENGETAIAQAFSVRPDIILMDVNLPKVNGFEASRVILSAWADAKIVVLTNQDDADVLAKFWELGVYGFLLKDIELDALISALEKVQAGQKLPLTDDLQSRLNERQKKVRALSEIALTERETEVLKALAKGYSNQQLADLLCVSPKTVHNHLYNIYSKIGVTSRSEAIVWAMDAGF